jgi:hypothetical protein
MIFTPPGRNLRGSAISPHTGHWLFSGSQRRTFVPSIQATDHRTCCAVPMPTSPNSPAKNVLRFNWCLLDCPGRLRNSRDICFHHFPHC